MDILIKDTTSEVKPHNEALTDENLDLALSRAMVSLIFTRFHAIYRDKWTRFVDDQIMKNEWSISLKGFTEQEIIKGIEHCKEYCNEPPYINEFIRYCRPVIIGAHQDAAPILQQNRDFEKGRKSVQMIHMNKIWQTLGNKRRYTQEEINEAIELENREMNGKDKV